MVTRHASAGWAARRQFAVLVMLLELALLAPGTSGAHTRAIENPIGVHSMLYLTHPFSAKQAMFEEAAAVGASTIRLDIELSGVFPDPNGPPDWSGVDQYMWLRGATTCACSRTWSPPPGTDVDCPPEPPADGPTCAHPATPPCGAVQAGTIAAHTPRRDQLLRDRQRTRRTLGVPRHPATVRRDAQASYDAIHAANPNAQVALGGLMNIGTAGRDWMNDDARHPGHGRHAQVRHRQHPRPHPTRPNRRDRRRLAAVLRQQEASPAPYGSPKPATPPTQPNKPTPATRTAPPPKPATSPP